MSASRVAPAGTPRLCDISKCTIRMPRVEPPAKEGDAVNRTSSVVLLLVTPVAFVADSFFFPGALYLWLRSLGSFTRCFSFIPPKRFLAVPLIGESISRSLSSALRSDELKQKQARTGGGRNKEQPVSGDKVECPLRGRHTPAYQGSPPTLRAREPSRVTITECEAIVCPRTQPTPLKPLSSRPRRVLSARHAGKPPTLRPVFNKKRLNEKRGSFHFLFLHRS